MRILVVGPVEGGSLPVGRSIYAAFMGIGQEAEFLDYSDFKDDFVRAVKARDHELSTRFLLKCHTRLMQKVLDFRPDAILGIAQSPMVNPEILIKLRNAGIILCFWFVEDYRLFDHWKSYARFFDHYFTIQKDPIWKKMEEMGCRNFHYLPPAFDANFEAYNDVQLPDINVSFVGAPYPNRVHFFNQFERSDFQIYGDNWNQHGNGSVVIGDRWVSEGEARSIYRRSLININLHSSQNPNSFGHGDFVNPRTFELAGLGAFQLTDVRELMPLHFDLGKEMVALTRWEDMTAAVDYFLKNESERRGFGKRAQERVLQEHTYRHRAEEIISLLS
ncbi:MAG: glycosyltransferase [Candidatus Desulfacyla sp.]